MLKIVVVDYGFNFELKTVVNNCDFNLKKFKTLVTNYGFDFDKNTIVWTLFFQKCIRLALFFLNILFWDKTPKFFYLLFSCALTNTKICFK